MPVFGVGGSSQIYNPDLCIFGEVVLIFPLPRPLLALSLVLPVRVGASAGPRLSGLQKLIRLQEDVFRLQICMGESMVMHEPDGLEDLLEEGLDHFYREAHIAILFDHIVEGFSEGQEDQAKVALLVVKGLHVANEVVLVVLVEVFELFDHLSLHLRRRYVLLHRLDHLSYQNSTLIA